ncbi:MAG: hypothetical protein H0U57_04570 [Tatlockia sp.]|nr:hypothetical protein [Tatlockia sp.]
MNSDKFYSQEAPFFKVPLEIVEKNVCKELKITEVNNLSKSCIFFYDSLQEYKRRCPENVRNNIKKGNYNKRISEGLDEKIYATAISKDTLITAGNNSLKIWNRESGEILWSYPLILCKQLWVVNEQIICVGWKKTSENSSALTDPILLKIGLNNKEKSILDIPKMIPEMTILVENQLISKFTNGKIYQMDLSGNKIRVEAPINSTVSLALFGAENYIVDVSQKRITFINRSNGIVHIYEVPTFISFAAIDKNSLICGHNTQLDFNIIDMENIKITEYKINPRFLQNYLAPNMGSLNPVIVNTHYIFIAHESGRVFAFNKTEQNYETLAWTRPPNNHSLYSVDNFLFIINHNKSNSFSTINLWEIDSLGKLNLIRIYKDIYKLNEIKWDKGRLLIFANTSIQEYDFKVLHQGEILIKDAIDASVENSTTSSFT